MLGGEMNSEYGVFVGVGNALLLESLALMAILALWYGGQPG
jgi:hypothetical protein